MLSKYIGIRANLIIFNSFPYKMGTYYFGEF